jgi:hypothetical protein
MAPPYLLATHNITEPSSLESNLNSIEELNKDLSILEITRIAK